jgi:hypothetical protein
LATSRGELDREINSDISMFIGGLERVFITDGPASKSTNTGGFHSNANFKHSHRKQTL